MEVVRNLSASLSVDCARFFEKLVNSGPEDLIDEQPSDFKTSICNQSRIYETDILELLQSKKSLLQAISCNQAHGASATASNIQRRCVKFSATKTTDLRKDSHWVTADY